MSYAIRNDGLSWRAVSGPGDVGQDETYSETEPVLNVEPTVPQAVTPLQGLLALDQAGYALKYETWANDPARTFAERAFIKHAQTWRRDDAVLASAASAIGITEARLDELFTLAQTL